MDNRRFAELCGICWHEQGEYDNYYFVAHGGRITILCEKCGEKFCENERPDFAADPRLVLREMIQRNDWFNFVTFLGNFSKDGISYDVAYDVAEIINKYILDTTGQLRDRAVEWLERNKQ